jgi:hypothetical protein
MFLDMKQLVNQCFRSLAITVMASGLGQAQVASPKSLNYSHLADRIVDALKLRKGEKVLVRRDPGYFEELTPLLTSRIRAAGATVLGPLDYQPKVTSPPSASPHPAQSYTGMIESADVYLWLPLRTEVREVSAGERAALVHWLEEGGTHREIHFHWQEGSVDPDGLPGLHSSGLNTMYQDALDIDYAALSANQDRAITLLRSGVVHVTTPAGTDVRFRVGDRPFNKQYGDASPDHIRQARVRVDREIELPAGVLRVAPIEETVNGTIVVPKARFGNAVTRGLRLEIHDGMITKMQAAENLNEAEAALKAGGEAARHFREFGLGFNPKLQVPAGSPSLPYYGYGAGVVRMSLGDNEELGGAVRGGFTRWFFFPDTTVEVGGRALVSGGKLMVPGRP